MQWRRAGDTGWRCISGRFGCPEWWAGALFALALRAGVLGPVTALLGLDPVRTLDASVVQVVGMFCAITGVLGTIVTRLAMSTSWRIGVDETERTELVTNGPFALVRNPGARCATMVSAREISLLTSCLPATGLRCRGFPSRVLPRVHGQLRGARVSRGCLLLRLVIRLLVRRSRDSDDDGLNRPRRPAIAFVEMGLVGVA